MSRSVLRLLCSFVLLAAANASAQPDYPNRPVRVIVSSAAGGGSDFIVRPVVARMGENMGQTFVVDNRAGAAGIIAMELTAKAAPDGYTLLLGTIGNFASNTALHDKLPFDPIRDFKPLSKLVDSPFLLSVHPSVPATTLKEFIAYARANPGKVTFSSFGIGSYPHLLGEYFNQRVGAQMLHVPYKGSAPAIADQMAGHVLAAFDSMQSQSAHIRAKRLRALAIGSNSRVPTLPDLPTFAEAGLPDFEAVAWFGLFAPAKTSVPIVRRLHGEIVKAVTHPEVRERIEALGAVPVGNTPEEFALQIKADIDTQVRVARAAKIRAQ
ncbi:MAG: tripartite tricarboxylate transporter substrate binding protein [Proteobacteria bacterium]|nr:tripartite tricarboxylate transporter substrate binding protein [Burkholderiales bacterium]